MSAQALAQDPPQATFKSSVDLVTVSAAVRNSRGKVVRDLKKTDFEVLDSGVRVEIKDFYSGDSPISLAILLDISGSMAVGGNIERAREAIGMATANLRDRQDEAALFTFDSKLREVVGFTSDLQRVRARSLEGKPWGITSLFDAIEADRATGRRTRQQAPRAARDHRRRGHGQPSDSTAGILDRQHDRRAGVSAGRGQPGRPSGR